MTGLAPRAPDPPTGHYLPVLPRRQQPHIQAPQKSRHTVSTKDSVRNRGFFSLVLLHIRSCSCITASACRPPYLPFPPQNPLIRELSSPGCSRTGAGHQPASPALQLGRSSPNFFPSLLLAPLSASRSSAKLLISDSTGRHRDSKDGDYPILKSHHCRRVFFCLTSFGSESSMPLDSFPPAKTPALLTHTKPAERRHEVEAGRITLSPTLLFSISFLGGTF
jgi:hypothetical protein